MLSPLGPHPLVGLCPPQTFRQWILGRQNKLRRLKMCTRSTIFMSHLAAGPMRMCLLANRRQVWLCAARTRAQRRMFAGCAVVFPAESLDHVVENVAKFELVDMPVCAIGDTVPAPMRPAETWGMRQEGDDAAWAPSLADRGIFGVR